MWIILSRRLFYLYNFWTFKPRILCTDRYVSFLCVSIFKFAVSRVSRTYINSKKHDTIISLEITVSVVIWIKVHLEENKEMAKWLVSTESGKIFKIKIIFTLHKHRLYRKLTREDANMYRQRLFIYDKSKTREHSIDPVQRLWISSCVRRWTVSQ